MKLAVKTFQYIHTYLNNDLVQFKQKTTNQEFRDCSYYKLSSMGKPEFFHDIFLKSSSAVGPLEVFGLNFFISENTTFNLENVTQTDSEWQMLPKF